jgi:hypothetical protein
MKKYFILSLLFLVINSNLINAQSDYNWEPIGLTLTGNNNYQGVEAFYRVAECDGEYYLILKFINENENKVIIEWEDGIFTQDKVWVSNSVDNKINSIIIEPESEITCDCTQPIDELFVKIREFIPDFDDFFKYRTISLTITVIEE